MFMTRDLQFEPESVLDLVLDQFWAHGFNDTSMRVLAGEVGVSTSSLYNTFGDKKTIFLAALERYDTKFLSVRLHQLEQSREPLEAIRGLFKSVVSDCAADPVRRGCFLVNTALELSPHDPEIEGTVRRKLESIEAFFLRALKSARKRRELASTRNLKVVAAQLLATLLGIRVLARAYADSSTIGRVIEGALGILND